MENGGSKIGKLEPGIPVKKIRTENETCVCIQEGNTIVVYPKTYTTRTTTFKQFIEAFKFFMPKIIEDLNGR